MKKHLTLLLAGLAGFSIASQGAVVIDFEDYTLGDVAGQSSNSTAWVDLFGTNDATVVSYDGGKALRVTPDTGGTTFIPSAANLGFTFDNASSIINFSFDIARNVNNDDGNTLEIRFVDSDATNAYASFEFWGLGDGFASYTNPGASGDATSIFDNHTSANVNSSGAGYDSVSAIIDFNANEITSLTFNGLERLSTAVAIGTIADTGSTVGLYIVGPTGSTEMYVDNISIAAVPEPSTYALLAGFLTLGLVLVRRRLR